MQRYLRKFIFKAWIVIIVSGLFLTQISYAKSDQDITFEIAFGTSISQPVIGGSDPFEKINRVTFAFNRLIDKCFLRPVTVVYDVVVPDIAKMGISNFFANLETVTTLGNDILQGRGRAAMVDIWRIVINTTVGVGGLFDVATKLGLPKHLQFFDITLARWGIKNTPYLVLPFVGPCSISESVGIFIDYQNLSVWTHVYPRNLRYGMLGLFYVSVRDRLLAGDKAIDNAYDPYVFMKNAYWQRRAYLLNGQG